MSSNKHSTSHCAAHNCIHKVTSTAHQLNNSKHTQCSPRTVITSDTCTELAETPAAISCSYLDTGIWCSVVGSFMWLALWPGTRYQTTCEICHVPLTIFASNWKLFFSRFTNAHTRALDALWFYALYKSTIDKQKLGGGPSHTSTSELQQHAHKTVVVSPSSVNLNCSFTQHQSRQQQITWQVSQ